MRFDTSQQGIGLIEVLVSLLLLAIGVLGYIALQTQAITSTDESTERLQSLVVLRNLAEKIRANPSAVATYQRQLNSASLIEPSKNCGVVNSSVEADLCSPEQLAEAEVYVINLQLVNYGLDIKMHPCPSSSSGVPDPNNSILFSYCLISAWGNTTATIGSDATTDEENPTIDCLSQQAVNQNNEITSPAGSYHHNATCILMSL